MKLCDQIDDVALQLHYVATQVKAKKWEEATEKLQSVAIALGEIVESVAKNGVDDGG